MAVATTVVIDDYDVNPMTGYVTVTVHTHTVDAERRSSWDGPSKKYGIDLQAFRDRFKGDIEAYETWVANEHKSITGPPTGLVDALTKRKGRVIA